MIALTLTTRILSYSSFLIRVKEELKLIQWKFTIIIYLLIHLINNLLLSLQELKQVNINYNKKTHLRKWAFLTPKF